MWLGLRQSLWMLLSDQVGRTTTIRWEGGGCCCWMMGAARVSWCSVVFDQPMSSDEAVSSLLTNNLAIHPFLLYIIFFPSMCTGLDPKTVICEACQLAKHRRESFSSSSSHTTIPLSRIHNDVWGSAPHAGLKGQWWFLLVVDEATRNTWTYLLTTKSASTATVQQFCTMVQTQFGCRIQRFCLDNAQNFFNTDLDLHFASQGILHESSCGSTPEQNQIAEHHISNVTSTTCTLLVNYNVSWSYWGEAVLMASHLVNPLPSQSLQFSSPIDRMITTFLDVNLRMDFLPRCSAALLTSMTPCHH